MVIKHLKSKFNQIPGEDVFYMHEKLKVDECQTLIKYFNNVNFKEKVMLASIGTYSEVLNLVSASRVVLLDIM
jgi:DNA repair and recombination RAD54-like protein